MERQGQNQDKVDESTREREAHYSVETTNALQTMGVLVDENCSVRTLRRFLVARKGNTEEAAKMLNRNLKWRSQNLPIALSSCKSELASGIFYQHEADEFNRPIFIFNALKWSQLKSDVQTILNVVLYLLEVSENVLKCSMMKFRFNAIYFTYCSSYLFFRLLFKAMVLILRGMTELLLSSYTSQKVVRWTQS